MVSLRPPLKVLRTLSLSDDLTPPRATLFSSMTFSVPGVFVITPVPHYFRHVQGPSPPDPSRRDRSFRGPSTTTEKVGLEGAGPLLSGAPTLCVNSVPSRGRTASGSAVYHSGDPRGGMSTRYPCGLSDNPRPSLPPFFSVLVRSQSRAVPRHQGSWGLYHRFKGRKGVRWSCRRPVTYEGPRTGGDQSHRRRYWRLVKVHPKTPTDNPKPRGA